MNFFGSQKRQKWKFEKKEEKNEAKVTEVILLLWTDNLTLWPACKKKKISVMLHSQLPHMGKHQQNRQCEIVTYSRNWKNKRGSSIFPKEFITLLCIGKQRKKKKVCFSFSLCQIDSLLCAKMGEFLERDLACFAFTKPASVV